MQGDQAMPPRPAADVLRLCRLRTRQETRYDEARILELKPAMPVETARRTIEARRITCNAVSRIAYGGS